MSDRDSNTASRQVIVAENAGFCFGVARATAAVEQEMHSHPAGERIFTLGRLIHNDTYNQRLAAGGVSIIGVADIKRLATEASFLTCPTFVSARPKTPRIKYRNITCPYITRYALRLRIFFSKKEKG